MLSTPTAHSTRQRPLAAHRPYTAYGAAATMWASKRTEVVLSGPAGTGKSRACLEKLHFCAMKYPGMRALIVRKTRESLSEAALVTFEEKVLPEGSPLKDGPRRNFRQAYHYANGSEVVVGGLDKPGKIMSTEYDLVYVQEAVELDESAWLALTTRLRNGVMPYQQLLADCNPDAPNHWLRLRSIAGTTLMLDTSHEDNPRLYNQRRGEWTQEGREYIKKLDDLGYIDPETGERTGTEYQRLRGGLWVQASGLIYDVWADGPSNGSVTEAAGYVPDGGPIYWGVDDGYTGERDARTGLYTPTSHPRVFLLCQQRPDGVLNVFNESYAIKKMSDKHIDEVLLMGHALPYPRPEFAAVDKSAAELKGRLHAQEIYTRNGPADVEESIKVARRWLAPDGNGVRRILVHPRCRHLRAEMASYRRDPQTGKPIKEFDHGPDALRYLVWQLRHEQ